MNVRLSVTLSDEPVPPTTEHNLLVGFCFGAGPAQHHPALVSTQLIPIGCDLLYESWWVKSAVEFTNYGALRIAESEDYAVLIFESDEEGSEDYKLFVRDAYHELLNVATKTTHTRLAKIWNYIGGINDGTGDQERYRQFSVGRAMAFSELGLPDTEAPTGTGIGMTQDCGLTIIALCSQHPFSLAENPRQVSAFDYPRRYGPKSPKFGRGGSIAAGGHSLRLFSGTAAIVGHESMHPGDTIAQLDETLRNLDSICDVISQSDNGEPRLVLDDRSVLRVYLRNPDDYPFVLEKLHERLGPTDGQIAFLHGSICRRELLLEIDGIRVC